MYKNHKENWHSTNDTLISPVLLSSSYFTLLPLLISITCIHHSHFQCDVLSQNAKYPSIKNEELVTFPKYIKLNKHQLCSVLLHGQYRSGYSLYLWEKMNRARFVRYREGGSDNLHRWQPVPSESMSCYITHNWWTKKYSYFINECKCYSSF